MIAGSSILITGGTGSFGRAITRHLLRNLGGDDIPGGSPARVAILSRDELKQSEMRAEFGDDARLRFFLGDVRDRDRLRRAFRGVDYVLHAAALKQVPAAEYNPTEFVRTNVYGTENVIEAAIDAGVKRAVLLSTDKACSPSTLYGSTKLVAERLFVAANSLGSTRFACTRYGNVAGSRGSVLEVWRKAVSEGKPIPITHPEMTRFHMTQPEAVALVLLALREMEGGEIFVPKLPSYSVGSLAEVFEAGINWRLDDAPYPRAVTGPRPGEKLHESLVGSDESRTAAEFEGHYRIYPAVHPWRGPITVVGVPEGFELRSDAAPMKGAALARLLGAEGVAA